MKRANSFCFTVTTHRGPREVYIEPSEVAEGYYAIFGKYDMRYIGIARAVEMGECWEEGNQNG